MTIKAEIQKELKSFSPDMLEKTFQFLELIKKKSKSGKKDQIMMFGGSLASEDAQEVKLCIEKEFNSIEGEW